MPDSAVDLLVRSHRIHTPNGWLDGAVAVVGERVASLIPAGQPLPKARRTVDATASSQAIIPYALGIWIPDHHAAATWQALVDLDRQDAITAAKSYSKCGWTAFEGRQVQGVPVITILRGRVIVEENAVFAEPGLGRFVRVESTPNPQPRTPNPQEVPIRG